MTRDTALSFLQGVVPLKVKADAEESPVPPLPLAPDTKMPLQPLLPPDTLSGVVLQP